MDKKVIVVPYNEAWKSEFEEIKKEIKNAIGDLIIGIEHVGSTSVEGLSAKPCIDIDVIIKDYGVFDTVVSKLETIGYRYVGNQGIKDREVFKYSDKPHLQKHHLYVCPQWSKELYRHITFRNFLRSTPEAVKKYGSTKETAAQLFPDDMEKYMEYKSPCIEESYEMCGIKMYSENSYKELQVVKAKRVLSEKVQEGCLGTVVYVHSAKAYEVEFVNSEGATLEVLTVEEKDIMPCLVPYNEMEMPFEMVPFEKMNKKQVKQYFEWFMSTLDERCNRLQNYINLTGGNVVLDKSPESLVGLWEWFETRMETTQKTDKELEAELEGCVPRLRHHVLENVDKLSAETVMIAWDIAAYFGEVVRNNNIQIYWGYCSTPKKLNGVNRPRLLGFIGDMSVYVYGRVEVGIWKSLREKNKMRLYNMYVICKEMM